MYVITQPLVNDKCLLTLEDQKSKLSAMQGAWFRRSGFRVRGLGLRTWVLGMMVN